MIRPATLQDVQHLVHLGAAMHAESSYAGEPYVHDKVDTLMRRLISGEGVVFVFERDGEVLGGMAGGITVNWFNEQPVAFEYGLFIAKHARHGMAAAKLILAFCIWCQRKGAKRVRVGITTGVQTEGTARLYRSLGFADDGVFLTKEF